MGPPEAVSNRRADVPGRVCHVRTVVFSVPPRPPRYAFLRRTFGDKGKGVLESARSLERLVGEKSVISDCYPPHPKVVHHHNQWDVPPPERHKKWRGYGDGVHCHKRQRTRYNPYFFHNLTSLLYLITRFRMKLYELMRPLYLELHPRQGLTFRVLHTTFYLPPYHQCPTSHPQPKH